MAQYAFYTSSEKTWAAMLSAIKTAQRSIYMEMYIFVDDMRGIDFTQALGRKAEEGARVKLVLDSFGSFALSKGAIETLRKSGVEVLFFSRWLHRLHRKLLIVDERIAITGGVNIHIGAERWDDLAVEIEGTRMVRTALGFFAMTYFRAGGTDAFMHKFLKHDPFVAPGVSFLSSGFHTKLNRLYREKISEAKHSIVLLTPYFAPSRWLIAALDTAALRGIAVDIIIPKTGDSWFMDRANHFYMLKMGNTNVRFFLFPKMNHAKVLVIDGAEALVGSQNLDALSFDRNLESGVLLSDHKMIQEVCRIVEAWKGQSEAFQRSAYSRRWYDYVLAPIIRLLQPFL